MDIRHHHLVVSFTLVAGVAFTPTPSAAWSLFKSDASKYQNECRKACVEDSFSRAQAREIQQRCSAKCDDLPLSPRDLWDAYDSCEDRNQQYRDFYQKNSAAIATCESALDAELEKCRKRFSPPSRARSSEYVPGEFANAYRLEKELESCERSARNSKSNQCDSLATEKIVKESIYSPRECSRPAVSRPR